MAFGDDDLRAMEADMGVPVRWRGAEVGPCLFGTRVQTSPDDVGFGVQRTVLTLRTRRDVLKGWARDDELLIDGKKYRLREKLDDAQTIDAAWDLFSVGAQ